MALVPCKQCGTEIADTAKVCPKCGAPTKAPTNWKLVAGVPLGLLVVFLVIGAMNSDPEKAKARAAIDLCLKQLDKKGLDLSELSFIQGACDMMEEKFRQRYGHAP